ncbi:MAG: glycosyltransferase family 61 protein [Bacteroidota bacterium]
MIPERLITNPSVLKAREAVKKGVHWINYHLFRRLGLHYYGFGMPRNAITSWKNLEQYIQKKGENNRSYKLLGAVNENYEIGYPDKVIGHSSPAASVEPSQINAFVALIQIPDASIYYRDFMLVSNDGILLGPFSHWPAMPIQLHSCRSKINYRITQHYSGKSLLIRGSLYYHFLFEGIATLLLALKSGYKLDDFDQVILWQYKPGFHDSILQYFGVPASKIVALNHINDHVRCETLVSANFFDNKGPWLRENLLNFLKVPIPPLPTGIGKRIFISRNNAGVRNLLNEEGVMAVLRSYGFVCICNEDYSWLEQVAIMTQVDWVMGVHGSNLSNIVFMKPGTSLIELRYYKHDNYNKDLYYQIAKAQQVIYYLMYAQKGEEHMNLNGRYIDHANADIEIDTIILEHLLAELFVNKSSN